MRAVRVISSCWNEAWVGALNQLCLKGQLKEAFDAVDFLYQQGIRISTHLLNCILQGCIRNRDLAAGRRVESLIIQTGYASNIFLGNQLICMFSACGSWPEANRVFNKMPRTDVFLWAGIIAASVQNGHYVEATKLYDGMCESGVKPNDYILVSVVKACTSIGALTHGRLIHKDILSSGSELNVFVGTTLIDMYAKCGSLEDAEGVFRSLGNKNLVSWNSIIGGYAQHGTGHEALLLFQQMLEEGFQPNEVTVVSVLKACANLAALDQGKLLHARIETFGYELDVFLGSTLIDMYIKCGDLENAHRVFGSLLVKDLESWNVLIAGYTLHGNAVEALKLFQLMQEEGTYPDGVTFVSILKACAWLTALDLGKLIHGQIEQSGFWPAPSVGNALIDMYAKCCMLDDARSVFERLPERNLVSYNILIAAYVQDGDGQVAVQLFREMQEEGVQPNRFTVISFLRACGSVTALDEVKLIHAHIMERSTEAEELISLTLTAMYSKCSSPEDAAGIFEKLPVRSILPWNTVIERYTQHQLDHKIPQLQDESTYTDEVAFQGSLEVCCRATIFDQNNLLYARIVPHGLEADVFVGSTLIDVYAKCGDLLSARKVFERLSARNVVSWNAMIGGYAHHGEGLLALKLFEQMTEEPDEVTFVALLSACSHSGFVDHGFRLFKTMSEDIGIAPQAEHFVAMVDLLGRAGHVEDAEDLIDQMPSKTDARVWVSLLAACRTHSNVDVAERAFHSILELDPTNAAAFLLMANIYAAAGRYEDTLTTRRQMHLAGAKKEPGRTWMQLKGEVHSFVVEDKEHRERIKIYAALETLKGAVIQKLRLHSPIEASEEVR